MTQRTYKGNPVPAWVEYVVIGPHSGGVYWATDHRRTHANRLSAYPNDLHVRKGWLREELDPLPVEEVWGVFSTGSVVDAKLLNTYRTEGAAADKARELARGYTGRTFIVARITQKITQPKPVLPELIVEKF